MRAISQNTTSTHSTKITLNSFMTSVY